jgi:hypothetical protein
LEQAALLDRQDCPAVASDCRQDYGFIDASSTSTRWQKGFSIILGEI